MAKSKKGRHTTTGKKLGPSVKWLEGFNEVEKVVLSLSESCRTQYPPGHLRYTRDAPGGIKLVGHSDNGVVNIFVKVSDKNKDQLLKAIEKKFEP
tara:strand:- start:10463 stop:10747 length:285 start_codon:yes stop_codon:yes gene_type:complete